MTRGKLDLTSVAAMIQPIRTRSLIYLPNTWTLLGQPKPRNDEGEVGFDQRGGYDTANKNTFSYLSAKYVDAIGQPKPGNDEGEVGLDQRGGRMVPQVRDQAQHLRKFKKLRKQILNVVVNHCSPNVNVSAALMKRNFFFLIYKEIQKGAVAKSYMRKGFLILYMRKCVNI
jgi:hypothetical protein